MPDRPLIFSAEAVLAILDGRKTMTRRIHTQGKRGWVVPRDGDRYWVKEAFALSVKDHDALNEEETNEYYDAVYKADGGGEWSYYEPDDNGGFTVTPCKPQWRPPLFMPRWASRLTLEVTGFSIERLHSIPESDVYAEGLTEEDVLPFRQWFGSEAPWMTFANRWNSINGKRYSWESNPWVRVISFRRLP